MNASGQRCLFCGSVLYGRSDKRYCSSTCRRDASRTRKRWIRIGDYEFLGSEWSQSDSVEAVLIPRLEREYGPNHRVVEQARRRGRELREAALEELRRQLESFDGHED